MNAKNEFLNQHIKDLQKVIDWEFEMVGKEIRERGKSRVMQGIGRFYNMKIEKGQIWKNKKSGTPYEVKGLLFNVTRNLDETMVEYNIPGSQIIDINFCREVNEFLAKFEFEQMQDRSGFKRPDLMIIDDPM